MRISDLSSDVCSSDLDQRLVEREIGKDRDDAGGHHDRLAADLVAKPAEEDETGDDDRQRGGDEEIGGGAIDPGDPFEIEERIEMRGETDPRLHRDQIGRASCRESGCQYVSISGVAGTVKKKNTTKKQN